MFGKIKGKLKDVFKSSEELVEENHDAVEEVEISNINLEEKENLIDEIPKPEPEFKEEKKDSLFLDEKKVESNEIPVPEENILEDLPEEVVEKKSGFLGRLFRSKKEEEVEENEIEELDKLEDEMLEDVSDSEKKSIKEHIDLSENEILENKKELEEKILVEEKLEEEVIEDIDNKFQKIPKSDLLEDENEIENTEISSPNVEIKSISKPDIDEELDKVLLEPLEDLKDEKKVGFLGKTFSKLKVKTIDDSDFDKIWMNLQLFLLEINIAYEIVEKIEVKLKEELLNQSFNRFKISDKIREVLESEVENVLKTHEASFLDKLNSFDSSEPIKILVLGVNGTGKTTTIAKIVKYLQDNNKSVCVAAADTFRAAAVEQLEEHSKALNFKLIMHKGGSDPAAVAYDAISHAKAKKLDVVLIDTAGRMPNNSNLMMELEKVKRVSKSDMAIFVGDSVSGNDLIDQINLFNQGVIVDGAILTKVDTDERPGSVVTIAYSIDKPIYFLGVGQGYDDLIVFDSKDIAEKLFDIDEE